MLVAFLAGAVYVLPRSAYFGVAALLFAACSLLAVGIGINVNNRVANAPADLQRLAISLADVVQRDLDRTELLIHVLRRFFERLRGVVEDQAEVAEMDTHARII